MNEALDKLYEDLLKHLEVAPDLAKRIVCTVRDPFAGFGDLLVLLEESTGVEKPIPYTAHVWWLVAMYYFGTVRHLRMSARLLTELYRIQSFGQSLCRERIHKGATLYQLGAISLSSGQYPAAKRYFALALIEDSIAYSDDPVPNTPACQALRCVHGVSAHDLEQLVRLTREEWQKSPETAMFPEHCLLRFSAILTFQTHDIEERLVHFNPSYFQRLMSGCYGETTGAEAKGEALENLAQYMFSCIDGIEIIKRDVQTQSGELDLLLRNLVLDHPVLREMGTYILVECKHLTARVDVRAVDHFLSQVRYYGCKSGILIAPGGISGTEERKFAELNQVKALNRDGIVMVVLDKADLDRICAGSSNLLSLIVEQYERVRFDLQHAALNGN